MDASDEDSHSTKGLELENQDVLLARDREKEIRDMANIYQGRKALCQRELNSFKEKYNRHLKSAEELLVKLEKRETETEHSRFIVKLERERLGMKKKQIELCKEQIKFYEKKLNTLKEQSSRLSCPRCRDNDACTFM